MKLSELIKDAQRTLDEFGDIPVVVPETGCGCCKMGTYDEAEVRVEKNSISVWKPSGTEELSIAYIVSD